MGEEFRMFGMTVPRIAILNGILLSAYGVFSYFAQSAEPPSVTALIPAFLGFPMFLLGFLSEKNVANRHHYMHSSMVLALVMALLGSINLILNFSGMSILVIVSHLLLIQVGVSFIIVGIMSFRNARLNRESSVVQ
tara:strand:- start:5416 stop:5823 length:408 start_codon:yes stop_codon:yes gene_type:complete